MVELKDAKIAYFDVDETLISWDRCDSDDIDSVEIVSKDGETFHKRMINENITKLIELKLVGHTIIVWSAGGGEWAARVVKALDIENYVDVCLTKPDYYYDDKDVTEWMPQRSFGREQMLATATSGFAHSRQVFRVNSLKNGLEGEASEI